MPHQIIVNDIDQDKAVTERFRQTVDVLDIAALIQLINRPTRKPRADKGAKRAAILERATA